MSILMKAAEKAVKDCLGLQPGEKFVLIYDEAAVKIAAAVKNVAEEVTNGNSQHFCMENYGMREGANPLKFPSVIKRALENADASFFLRGKTINGERGSFTWPMIAAVEANPKLRHAHSPGITEVTFLSGMSVDYLTMRKFTSKINYLVNKAKKIRVKTPAGSDFTATFSPEYRWIMGDGFPTQSQWLNLPDGETFTSPVSLEGKIVVDGVLGDGFDQKYGLLDKNPLKIKARNGRIVSVKCFGNPVKKTS